MSSKLSAHEGVSIQGIFFNLYQNGSDHCPYHRDQYGTDVYTLSLGAQRGFLLKPDDKTQKTISDTLKSGDLYFMDEQIHKTHKHSIPKRVGVNDPRISIVFFTTKL